MNWDLNFPPVGSPLWRIRTRPLLEYIKTKGDRSIAEIIAWGRERDLSGTLIRHMLAWLSYSDLVYYVAPNTAWRIGAEPAGVAETWDKLDLRSSKSRRLLEPIPQTADEDGDSSDDPEDPRANTDSPVLEVRRE